MKLRQEYNKPVEENKELEATKEVPMNFLSSSLLAKQKAKLVKPKYTLFANSKQPKITVTHKYQEKPALLSAFKRKQVLLHILTGNSKGRC